MGTTVRTETGPPVIYVAEQMLTAGHLNESEMHTFIDIHGRVTRCCANLNVSKSKGLSPFNILLLIVTPKYIKVVNLTWVNPLSIMYPLTSGLLFELKMTSKSHLRIMIVW